MAVFLNGAALVAADSAGPADPSTRRMDLPSRYVLEATQALSIPEGVQPGSTGVFLGSSSGCLDVDIRFSQTLDERPSPRLFARTLPSTPAAEIALRFGFRGPDTCFVQDEDAGWLALLAAVQEIEAGACATALAGEYDAVDPGTADRGDPFAVVFLLGDSPLAGRCPRSLELAPTTAGTPFCPGQEAGLRGLYAGIRNLDPRASQEWAAGSVGVIRLSPAVDGEDS